MTPTLYIAVVLTVLGYLLLLVTGINGIRHAKLLGLGFDGYAMSAIWLWIAISGYARLIQTLETVMEKGIPTGTIYASGEIVPYAGSGQQWVFLAIGFAICAAICLRSFVMVRNAKTMTVEARREHARTYAASLSLKAALKGTTDA